MMRRAVSIWLALWAAPLAAETTLASASVELAPMQVFGDSEELQRTTGSAHQVDAASLDEAGYDDINRVLNEVPGLYVRGEDGFGLRPNIGLRGASADRSQKLTLMEDGVLFGPAPYAAPAAYYFPLTRRMVGVEVYKGPAAIRFGPQTIGGALNLVSAPATDLREGLLSASLGSDGYQRLHGRFGGPLPGADAGLVEVIDLRSDGFKELDGGGDTGFAKTEGLLKWARPLGKGRVQLRLGLAQEVSDETYLGLSEADFRATPTRRYRASALDRMDWDWGGLRADYSAPVFGGELQASAYYHRFERAWRKFNNFREADIRAVLSAPDTPRNRVFFAGLTGAADTDPDFAGDDLLIGTNDRRFFSAGLQAELQRSAGRHQLRIGARLHADRIRRLHDEFAFEMQGGQLQATGLARHIVADNTGRATAIAAWLQDSIEIGRLRLVPGLRIEAVQTDFTDRLAGASNEDRNVVLLPGIGLNFEQSRHLVWLAGVHRGYSAASPGLADTEPEDAVNVEAGLRWRGRVGQLELIGFYSDYRNLTAVCTFSAGCDNAELGRQTNAGRVRVSGLESAWSFSHMLAAGLGLDLNASYTLTASEFREAFSSSNPQFGEVQRGFELPYIPEHRLHLGLGLEWRRLRLGLAATHVSAMRDSAGSGPIVPGTGSDDYTVVDLAAGWAWRPDIEFSLHVDNLADEDYVVSRRPFGARPGRSRQLRMGVEWRW